MKIVLDPVDFLWRLQALGTPSLEAGGPDLREGTLTSCGILVRRAVFEKRLRLLARAGFFFDLFVSVLGENLRN